MKYAWMSVVVLLAMVACVETCEARCRAARRPLLPRLHAAKSCGSSLVHRERTVLRGRVHCDGNTCTVK